MRGFIEAAEKIKKIETQLKSNPTAHYDLPPDIRPAELFGVPDEKRAKLIGAVLSTINKSQAEVKQIGITSASKKSHSANENVEKAKKVFVELEQVKKKFSELVKNKWQPLPQITTPKEYFNLMEEEP